MTQVARPAVKLTLKAMQPGDKLLLSQPLGYGLYDRVLVGGQLQPHQLEALETLRTPNFAAAPALACLQGVHAVTEATDHGLLGHVIDLCNSWKVGAHLRFAALPLLPDALAMATGPMPETAAANWKRHGARIRLAPHLGRAERCLLTDALAPGSLLVSCVPDTTTEVLSIFLQQSCIHVSVIGEIVAAEQGILVD
ncbi:MAG: selenide, water dikinase SelD [Pseudomonadota bacterium]|jgi:selenide,water dikinase